MAEMYASGAQKVSTSASVSSNVQEITSSYPSQLKQLLDFKPKEPGGVGLGKLLLPAIVLFVVLTPGLVLTLPGARCPPRCSSTDAVDPTRWGPLNFRTSFVAILFHTFFFSVALTAIYVVMLNDAGVACVRYPGSGTEGVADGYAASTSGSDAETYDEPSVESS